MNDSKRASMRVFTVIGVVFILIGVFVGLISPINFKSHAKPVQAHIEDIKESFESTRYRGEYKTEKIIKFLCLILTMIRIMKLT